MRTIHVDVVSAEESIFSGEATFVALPGEAGELVAEFQWLTAEASGRSALSAEKLSDIELEIADVAIYLIRLADVLDVDVASVVRKKLAINESRF